MTERIGTFTAEFKLELPPAHKLRLKLAAPLVYLAQWLVGGPIKIVAVTDTNQVEVVRAPVIQKLVRPGIIVPGGAR